jgi:hypothetical protein
LNFSTLPPGINKFAVNNNNNNNNNGKGKNFILEQATKAQRGVEV